MILTPEAQVVGGWAWEHFKRAADRASRIELGRDAVVTAGYNGIHRDGSIHYLGEAFDLRVWKNPRDYNRGRYDVETCKKYASQLKKQLGDCWDIVTHYDLDEDGIEYVTHIHCELDLT